MAGNNSRELERVEFANPTKETFTGLKVIDVAFNARPTRATYFLTTATVDGLTEADLADTTVTAKNGEDDYSANFTPTVKNGRLALANSKAVGFILLLR